MLKGCDVSGWQNPATTDISSYDFVIIKATEGVSIVDSQAKKHYANATAAGKLTGFYHYARPEYNTAEAEVNHFLSVVKPYVGKSILALDYEGVALAYGATWAKQWLDILYKKTGVKAVIYLQGSVVAQYGAVCDADYGLWVAHWGVASPRHAPWQTYALWQYRGDPLDLDVFNGDQDAWAAYAASQTQEKPVDKPKDPPVADDGYSEFLSMYKRARDDTDPFYKTLKDVPEYWRSEVERLIDVGAIRGDGENTVGKRRSELEALIPAARYTDWYFGMPENPD